VRPLADPKRSASVQPLTGKIYARFSSKARFAPQPVHPGPHANLKQWVFLAFFAVFELGSLICALAQSSAMFIGGRVIAGLGCSGLQNGALTIIADVVELGKRPSAFSP
jgi:MFS family permease